MIAQLLQLHEDELTGRTQSSSHLRGAGGLGEARGMGTDGKMLWSGDGAILAVAGFRKSQALSTVRFFQPTGQLLFTLPMGTKVRKTRTGINLKSVCLASFPDH